VAKFYLSVFKQIQFFLPDHVFTERECNLLWVNRKYLAGHSRWLIPLIKSINWKKISIYDKKEVIELLTKSKTHTCKQLMCSGHCNSQFSPEDSIISLYPYIEEKEVRRYIFDSLSKAPVEELLSYLPYMVYICRFYYNKVKNKCQISNFLIHLSTQNYVFLNYSK
jgi:phosphatidylinositol 3-kinase